ncbi:conserved Plasmodium protein, unknown function [Plasmodium ovale]|uniref:Uncharacterized protein n=2 Tax=Plasmodium ovale TaxID=36330 RepID=A0A1A8WFI4_PLAOA|nr:conserved Plasmodium protein, unknown function [Plasmodium ovale curtisi]SBS91709.1 conserved Plasmodium protein, unknown function [Plasmodium ovale curtisi]SCP04676.1 conserved Plasmodium protein, unknown function [Plasmodium ovale]
MCEDVLRGVFYRDCSLYVGEYILSSDRSKEPLFPLNKDELGKMRNDLQSEISKEKVEKKVNRLTKREEIEKENKEQNADLPERDIIFQGKGKYIKQDEIFAGVFQNNQYRNGIWVKYKNMHNLFFYMNVYNEMDGKKGAVKEVAKGVAKGENSENFTNFLYVPLKEVNIYIGEFDNNMFNGFGLYFFHPFLYVGYFVNNLMNGYGYIFYISSVSERKEEGISSKNNIASSNNMFDFLFAQNRERKTDMNEGVVKRDSIDEKTFWKDGKDTKCFEKQTSGEVTKKNLLLSVYKKLERIVNGRDEFDRREETRAFTQVGASGKEETSWKNITSANDVTTRKGTFPEKDVLANLVKKVEEDMYKNVKLQVKRKNQMKKIKRFFEKNEKENLFDILKYISYENIFVEGYFYNGTFSSNVNKQELNKKRFIDMYKNSIVKKMDDIKNSILRGMIHDDLKINEHNTLYILNKRKKEPNIEGDNDTSRDAKQEYSSNDITTWNTHIKEDTPNESFRGVIDLTMLKDIFELTNESHIDYSVEVVTDKKILKYMNTYKALNIPEEENNLSRATLHLNGYHQLVVLNVKSKGETSFDLTTSKCNITNVNKIKMFLISSDKSSLIKYSTFFLCYVFAYTTNIDKKNKVKAKKKRN